MIKSKLEFIVILSTFLMVKYTCVKLNDVVLQTTHLQLKIYTACIVLKLYISSEV